MKNSEEPVVIAGLSEDNIKCLEDSGSWMTIMQSMVRLRTERRPMYGGVHITVTIDY